MRYPSVFMILCVFDVACPLMLDVAVAYHQCLHCVIRLWYLLPSIKSGVGFYPADVVDTYISYSHSINLSVIVLNALPMILTKLNCLFILVDIPAKKHASSSCIYILNVAPRH
jgi:hypothetical protein